MALNKTTVGQTALVYIIDADNKKVLDIVQYQYCKYYMERYNRLLGVRTTASYFSHVKSFLNA